MKLVVKILIAVVALPFLSIAGIVGVLRVVYVLTVGLVIKVSGDVEIGILERLDRMFDKIK